MCRYPAGKPQLPAEQGAQIPVAKKNHKKKWLSSNTLKAVREEIRKCSGNRSGSSSEMMGAVRKTCRLQGRSLAVTEVSPFLSSGAHGVSICFAREAGRILQPSSADAEAEALRTSDGCFPKEPTSSEGYSPHPKPSALSASKLGRSLQGRQRRKRRNKARQIGQVACHEPGAAVWTLSCVGEGSRPTSIHTPTLLHQPQGQILSSESPALP